jgi:hypothetical protein
MVLYCVRWNDGVECLLCIICLDGLTAVLVFGSRFVEMIAQYAFSFSDRIQPDLIINSERYHYPIKFIARSSKVAINLSEHVMLDLGEHGIPYRS